MNAGTMLVLAIVVAIVGLAVWLTFRKGGSCSCGDSCSSSSCACSCTSGRCSCNHGEGEVHSGGACHDCKGCAAHEMSNKLWEAQASGASIS